jgi:nicotinate-nucleotide pyrophosphorylase (carboxylating)
LSPKTYTLDKILIHQFIVNSLAEDVGDGDHTSLATIPAHNQGKAKLLVKEEGILAGVDVAVEIFYTVDANLKVEVILKDGAAILVGDIVLTVQGNSQSILKAERLVLNCMQRMSAIDPQNNTGL